MGRPLAAPQGFTTLRPAHRDVNRRPPPPLPDPAPGQTVIPDSVIRCASLRRNHAEDAEERREDAEKGFLCVLTLFLRVLRVILLVSACSPNFRARRESLRVLGGARGRRRLDRGERRALQRHFARPGDAGDQDGAGWGRICPDGVRVDNGRGLAGGCGGAVGRCARGGPKEQGEESEGVPAGDAGRVVRHTRFSVAGIGSTI